MPAGHTRRLEEQLMRGPSLKVKPAPIEAGSSCLCFCSMCVLLRVNALCVRQPLCGRPWVDSDRPFIA